MNERRNTRFDVANRLMLASLLVLALFASCNRSNDVCDECHRPMHAETQFQVRLEGGETRALCCPRCGMRFESERDDVMGAEVADYATKTLIDAHSAYFVEDSSVSLCTYSPLVREDRTGSQYQVTWDRCLPSLVAFRSRELADAFRKQNGGLVRTYEELLLESC